MSRDLSVGEKKLLNIKVPKALGQGRKSYETKIEANDVLHKAGYKPYFPVDLPTDHKDKKTKLNRSDISTDIGAYAVPTFKPILKTIKDISCEPKGTNEPKVCLCNIQLQNCCDHNFFT